MRLCCLLALIIVALSAQAQRPPWTSSRIHGSPEPPSPYTVERILPEVEFKNPVDFALEPGTNRWFVLQLDGKLFAIENGETKLVHDARADTPQHRSSYGITFHPNYQQNHELFLCYVLPNDLPEGTRVSRFVMRDGKVDSASEQIVITWPSGGHNGGCLKFGPDGCLYISTGDGSGPFPPDLYDVGQDLTDLRSTILRINVDQPSADLPYSVPEDNPFLHLDARPEVWAFGFRNPWKMSFDGDTNALWVGDVGWELWELLFRVERGGNYGWSIREGRQPIRNDLSPGPGQIISPIADHPHTEARSITGGFVCEGDRLPELKGHYIYGDYVTGKIWSVKREGEQISPPHEIADTSLAIITFGLDENGDLLIVDYAGGIYRLIPAPQSSQQQPFPRKLSETGLFTSLETLQPAIGVMPYDMIAEMWMDGLTAEHVLALPGTSSITLHNNHERWQYPEGTVFAKTVSLGTTRIETQVLHFENNTWNAYSYRWNDEQTDAELVPTEGATEEIANDDSVVRYRFHSRGECLTCHMPTAGFAIGFDLPNLTESTLASLTAAEVFKGDLSRADRVKMVDPHDSDQDLDARARSYLAINCAHCHRRGGGGTARIEFPVTHQLEQTNAVDQKATQGDFGIPDGKVISPQNRYYSVLYYRMGTVGRGRMPHLGSTECDEQGLKLIGDWIDSLGDPASKVPLEDDQVLTTVQAMVMADRKQSPEGEVPAHLQGLFDRHKPISERRHVLGASVDPQQIIALRGDIESGRKLFMTTKGINCLTCHDVDKTESDKVGPALAEIGSKRAPYDILLSILEPSRVIEPRYATQSIATVDGQVFTGIFKGKNVSHTILQDAQGKLQKILNRKIEDIAPQTKSLMPELQAKDLTAQELADLLAFLVSLKEKAVAQPIPKRE